MNNQQMSARDFHKRAERAREHGSFIESLNFCELAFEIYSREKNSLGMSEVCASMFLSLRHLSEKYDDISYLLRAEYIAQVGYEIAKNSGNRESLSIPAFSLAEAHYSIDKYKTAVKLYKEAIKTLPDSPHNSALYMLNMVYRFEIAKFRDGDKKALDRACKALLEMENINDKSYEKDVWLSGGYMRLGESIYRSDKKKAREYLAKAKEIIDSNPELTIRKNQLVRLQEKLS